MLNSLHLLDLTLEERNEKEMNKLATGLEANLPLNV